MSGSLHALSDYDNMRFINVELCLSGCMHLLIGRKNRRNYQ